ncbi:MAG: NUDIX hydrolase [Gammaproteobacteria bacterium]|nr:NUDIX hydrolase [Gammaproteobacteria bacterium]MDH3374034.1 NUDIX hydrolase [Gammaproteobacteria bacterium]MDH3408192.1 NUDIX hydrolase [Gammaproteobacteria bacterium]
MYPTDLTVSAVVEDNGNYLLVEEHATGQIVLNQPGGHIEAGESPEAAVVREVLEETGCHIACGELVGVYLWIHPQSRQQFLRLVFTAELLGCDEERILDDTIVARCWMTREDIEHRRKTLRSPVVLRCVHDYEAGKRQSDGLLSGMLPLQQNVDAVLANADLV